MNDVPDDRPNAAGDPSSGTNDDTDSPPTDSDEHARSAASGVEDPSEHEIGRESTAADSSADDAGFESRGSGMRGRDVAVPMRVYKTVTVFSTLIAVVCVVGGFIVLDRATERAQLPLSEVDPVLGLLGVGTILFGAVVYAFGTRFRAAGMGKSKNDDDEVSDNG